MAKFKKWLFKKDLKDKIKKAAETLSNIISVPPNLERVPKRRFNKTNEGRQSKAHDATEKYWLEPSKIQPWLKSHGIEWSNELPSYKDGGAGRAYMLGNHVVKFTANKVEANVAAMTIEKSIPPIIDVLPIDGMYAILQNFVDMNSVQNIKDAADYVTAIVDDYPNIEGFPVDKESQKKLSLEVLSKYGGSPNLVPYMMSVMTALATLYGSTGFKHDDAGPTNIGMYKDKIVFPDLGPNETGDFDTDKAMEKIGHNRDKLKLPPWKSI